jgi:hypothetical protein
MQLQVLMGVGFLEFVLVPVSSVCGWGPPKLLLPAKCLRRVSVIGLRYACGFRLTCGIKRLLLYVGGERGTIITHGLHALADTIAAAFGRICRIILLPSFTRGTINYRLLVALLARRGRCSPGYGNGDANLSFLSGQSLRVIPLVDQQPHQPWQFPL